MYLKNEKKSRSKDFNLKNLLISSGITISMLLPKVTISQPVISSKFNEINQYQKKSFITKAVEKTGSSVVTIDTQRYVKKRKFPRNYQPFLDPYFDRFFGLDLPNDDKPTIEQSQGSGFIFADGLVMTNAHVVNGSDKVIIGLTNGKKLKENL